jgi:hypothetical protein
MFALPYVLFLRLHRAALAARRRERTWRYLAWSVAAGLCAGALVCVAAVFALMLGRAGLWSLAALMLAVLAVPVVAAPLVRHVLVPLGWPRASFWVAHVATVRDSDAFALACAAWAHTARPTPRSEAWITARRDRRSPLGDSEIVVTAWMAAARGDVEAARSLLRSLDHVVEYHPEVRELASEWLACDAAERGAWHELVTDAETARAPATALTFLLEGVAHARVGSPRAPSSLELRARWLLAPHRRQTRALIVAPPVTAAPVSSDCVEPAVERELLPLPRAIDAHLRGVDVANQAALDQAVHAWDAALVDHATRMWLAQRAVELGAPLGAADRALREVTTAAADELARVAEVGALGSPASRGPVGDALARRLRHGRLDALEAAFTRWGDRRRRNELRAPIDEWRELMALRTAYDEATHAGGLELRRLAFPHAYATGSHMAAWLWNARKEYVASHAISAWLLAEALAVGDAEAIELCTRNVALRVPTRLGDVTGA